MLRTNDSSARIAGGWLIPCGLLLLSVLPLIGGTVRLIELGSDVPITPQNARFFAAPIPLIIHVVSSLLYFVLGAFQFSPKLRSRKPQWHRFAGRILIPSGLLSAVTGIWMAATYPPLFGHGIVLMMMRIIVGASIVLFIAIGFLAIRRRDIARHRASMTRAYALAIAAGTQPITLGLVMVLLKLQGELGFTLGMAAGWLLNAFVAELVIRKRQQEAMVEIRGTL